MLSCFLKSWLLVKVGFGRTVTVGERFGEANQSRKQTCATVLPPLCALVGAVPGKLNTAKVQIPAASPSAHSQGVSLGKPTRSHQAKDPQPVNLPHISADMLGLLLRPVKT